MSTNAQIQVTPIQVEQFLNITRVLGPGGKKFLADLLTASADNLPLAIRDERDRLGWERPNPVKHVYQRVEGGWTWTLDLTSSTESIKADGHTANVEVARQRMLVKAASHVNQLYGLAVANHLYQGLQAYQNKRLLNEAGIAVKYARQNTVTLSCNVRVHA